jgi:hypothetical protein
MERIYHSPNFTNSSVREKSAHKKLYLQRILTLDMEDKTFVSSDMKRVNSKGFDDIVGDLKIDALYIFDKALLTTHQ